MSNQNSINLKRELNLFDAIMLGLGSILGTGVFVSIGIGAGIAGAWVVLAIFIAGLVATCNALSSAQLAAAHPQSGGTYEYGYQLLTPSLGFIAGWMFLLAKSASAATAALGFAGYLLHALGTENISATLVACFTSLVITLLVLSGLRRSSVFNIIIVSITLISLLIFSVACLYYSVGDEYAVVQSTSMEPENSFHITYILQATALMFVAFTGYGRVATLAEEIKNPKRNIPKAIIATLLVSFLIYAIVSISSIQAVGSNFLSSVSSSKSAPLESVAKEIGYSSIAVIIAIGAMTAMLGVLLNLILGLSRIYLAMGRREDMPPTLAKIDKKTQSPYAAIIITGLVISALTLIGDVKTTWSFSAFTVLIYYSITNASAIALPEKKRLFPKWISCAGLISCLFLAYWVDLEIWLIGSVLIVAGLIWKKIANLQTLTHIAVLLSTVAVEKSKDFPF